MYVAYGGTIKLIVIVSTICFVDRATIYCMIQVFVDTTDLSLRRSSIFTCSVVFRLWFLININS